MEIYGNLKIEFEVETGETVVVVTVGKEDGERFKFVFDNSSGNKIAFVTWINDDAIILIVRN